MVLITSLLGFLLLVLPGPGQGQVCNCPDNKCPIEQCPSDGNWVKRWNSCYRFLDNSHFTHIEAVRYCFLIHSDLVAINDDREDKFIQDFANRFFKPPTNQNATYWTGGFKYRDNVGHSGPWEWYAGAFSNMTYTNWAPGQPDNHDSTKSDCIALVGADGFTWHDRPCSEYHHSICEITLVDDDEHTIVG